MYVHFLRLFIYKKEVDFNHEYKYTWTASVKKKKHLESKIEFLQMHYYFLYVIISFDFRL